MQTLKKWGNSVAVRIPAPVTVLADRSKVTAGDLADVRGKIHALIG